MKFYEEEKVMMKGFDINTEHHVVCSLSVKEMDSHASIKICQVLQDMETYTRAQEGELKRVMSLQASKAKARSHTHARVAIAAARVNKCSLYMTRVH